MRSKEFADQSQNNWSGSLWRYAKAGMVLMMTVMAYAVVRRAGYSPWQSGKDSENTQELTVPNFLDGLSSPIVSETTTLFPSMAESSPFPSFQRKLLSVNSSTLPVLSQFPAAFELSRINGFNGFKLDGEAGGDYSGYSVSPAGDVNGDGYADLLIGAPYYAINTGRSYVVYGGPRSR